TPSVVVWRVATSPLAGDTSVRSTPAPGTTPPVESTTTPVATTPDPAACPNAADDSAIQRRPAHAMTRIHAPCQVSRGRARRAPEDLLKCVSGGPGQKGDSRYWLSRQRHGDRS